VETHRLPEIERIVVAPHQIDALVFFGAPANQRIGLTGAFQGTRAPSRQARRRSRPAVDDQLDKYLSSNEPLTHLGSKLIGGSEKVIRDDDRQIDHFLSYVVYAVLRSLSERICTASQGSKR